MSRRSQVLALAAIAAAVLAVGGSAAAGADRDPITVRGDAAALTGAAREDVTEVVVTRLDGTEQELELDGRGGFVYRADEPERGARLLRAYDGDRRLLSTVAPPAASPRCGGAAGPCPEAGLTGAPALALDTRQVGGRLRTTLFPLDPRSLAPLPGRRIELAGSGIPYAWSPDGSSLALTGENATVRVVDRDLLSPSPPWSLAAGERLAVRALAWLRADRIAAVVQRMSAPYSRYVVSRTLVVADPRERRVLLRRPLTSRLAVQGSASAGGRLVLLLQPSTLAGRTARVVLADARGTVRSATVEVGRFSRALAQTRLVVTPDGSRAFLFTWALGRSGGRVGIVDLATMRVSYRRLRPLPRVPLRPAAVSTIQALPLDRDTVAVAGAVATRDRDRRVPAAGVFLVDTRRWTARLVDASALLFAVHEGSLITHGFANRFGARGGIGVNAYDATGRRLYRLYGTRTFSRVRFVGRYGHVLPSPPQTRRLVFDVRAGRSLGTLPALARPLEIVAPPPSPAASWKRAASTREPSQSDPFSRISNEGTPVELSAEGRRVLERMGMPNARVFLLATSGGRAFYRLAAGPRGRRCFATGPASTVGRFGSVACVASGFPSRARPILDFSAFQLKRGEREPRLLRLEGIAADAVTAVALVGADGKVVARVPVERNVFALPSPPPPPLRALLALGAGDEVVHRQPFARPFPVREAKRRGVAGYGVRLTFPRDWDAELYRPRGGVTVGPILLVASFPLPAFRRVEDVAAAARRMPSDGVLIFLGEAGAGSRQRFPRAALPIRLARADVGARSARVWHDWRPRECLNCRRSSRWRSPARATCAAGCASSAIGRQSPRSRERSTWSSSASWSTASPTSPSSRCRDSASRCCRRICSR